MDWIGLMDAANRAVAARAGVTWHPNLIYRRATFFRSSSTLALYSSLVFVELSISCYTSQPANTSIRNVKCFRRGLKAERLTTPIIEATRMFLIHGVNNVQELVDCELDRKQTPFLHVCLEWHA